MNKRRMREIIGRLQEISRHSTMERASFSDITIPGNKPVPIVENQVTQFIRDRTRIWRDSWITSPLEEIIDELCKTLE